jgi:hypothetical protein
MAITGWTGPLVGFGVSPSTTYAAEYNEQRGPSFFDCYDAMLDPRSAYGYYPGGGTNALATKAFYGFPEGRGIVDVVLSSGSTNALVISSNTTPATGASVTLTPSTAKDTKATTIVAPETGLAVSVTCLGSTAVALTFGSDGGSVNLWNPAGIVGRCISITASCGVTDGGTWSVAGRDIYGFKITESVTASTQANTAVNTKKAFKYISSILACTTVTSTGVGIGLTDTIGLPLYSPNNGYTTQVLIVSSISSATGTVALATASYVPGSTATATSTTGDVRGTYASTTASNGTLRFQLHVRPTPGALQTMVSTAADTSGLFGVTQFSSV